MKRILVAVATAALVALGIFAAPTAALANGTVSGTITNSTATGIFNAVIEFQKPGSTNYYYTDSAGNYTADVPNGTYSVYIHADGYAPEFYNDSWTAAGAAVVVVDDSTNITINASLAPAAVISGHITDYANGPVEGQVFAASDNDPEANWFRGLTDPATGAYTIEDLSPGTYRVFVSTDDSDDLVDEWYNNEYTEASATPVVITATGSNTTIDVQLQRGGDVTGTIVNSIGSPVDLSVLLEGSNGPVNNRGDAYLGAYEINGLLPDTYVATAHDYSGFFQDAVSAPFAVTVNTPGEANFEVTPVIPDESEFYETIPDSGPTTVQAGKTYTWTVDVYGDSDAYVILYSDPVYLGAAVQNDDGTATLTVTIPASTPAGEHKLTWSSYSEDLPGDSRQFTPITVTAAAAPLPSTGIDASIALGGAALLLAAGAALVMGRRLRSR